eukprot:scaffold1727_cov61-Phaeocystis_antarctica.AAC.6
MLSQQQEERKEGKLRHPPTKLVGREQRPMWKTRWLRPRPTGAPGASFSARLCSRLPRASASLGQSAACAAQAGNIGESGAAGHGLESGSAGVGLPGLNQSKYCVASRGARDSKRHPANTTSRKPPRLEFTPLSSYASTKVSRRSVQASMAADSQSCSCSIGSRAATPAERRAWASEAAAGPTWTVEAARPLTALIALIPRIACAARSPHWAAARAGSASSVTLIAQASIAVASSSGSWDNQVTRRSLAADTKVVGTLAASQATPERTSPPPQVPTPSPQRT